MSSPERFGQTALAVFSFFAGLVFSMTGILFVMVAEVSRYSEPQVIMTSCILTGLGLMLTMAGINLSMLKNTPFSSRSFLAGVFLSMGGLLLFSVLYPESWFYPELAYAVVPYSLGIFLLMINLFVNYHAVYYLYQGSFMEDRSALAKNINVSENEYNDNNIRDGSVMRTFAGILLTNLLPGHPDKSEYSVSDKDDETFVTVGHGLNEVTETRDDIFDNADLPDETRAFNYSVKAEEDAVIDDQVAEKADQQGSEKDVDSVSTANGTKASVPFSDFIFMKKTNVKADDTMREASRKLLMYHFGKMVEHERGTKVGKDTEELHDMRVAAMRMRSAIEVLEDYLDMKEMSDHYKNIKSTRKVLGKVRDLDVFLEKIDEFLEDHPPERRAEMDPLTDSILIERAKNRGKMLVYLDDSKFNKFKNNFTDHLLHKKSWKMKSFKKGEPVPTRVKDVLPVLLYEQFATVRAYDVLVSPETEHTPSFDQYHELRIDVKILRYTLEFFREVLDSESKSVIKDLKALQDNLGDMHDAVVALELLENFEKSGKWGEDGNNKSSESGSLQDYPGVDAYIEYRKKELQDLLDAFPQAWANVIEPDFSLRFSKAISGIYTS
ncbi:MAG: CHAD domain containing protein [Methanolobus sp. T82-4]|nr:MAG: CHAD domain containing protein [Methanolobus sp. T82-4]